MDVKMLSQKVLKAYKAMCERKNWVLYEEHQSYLDELSGIVERFPQEGSEVKKQTLPKEVESSFSKLKGKIFIKKTNLRLEYAVQLIEDALSTYKADPNSAIRVVTDIGNHFEIYLKNENNTMSTLDYEFVADSLALLSSLQQYLSRWLNNSQKNTLFARQKVFAEDILQALQKPLLQSITNCANDSAGLLQSLRELSVIEADERDFVKQAAPMVQPKKPVRYKRRKNVALDNKIKNATATQVQANIVPTSQLLSSYELALLRLKRVSKNADDEIEKLKNKDTELEQTSKGGQNRSSSWMSLAADYVGSMFAPPPKRREQAVFEIQNAGCLQSLSIMNNSELWLFYPQLIKTKASITELFEYYKNVCKKVESSHDEVMLNEFLITNMYGFVRYSLEPLFNLGWQKIYCETLSTIEGLIESKKKLAEFFILTGLSLAGGGLKEVFATLEICSVKSLTLQEGIIDQLKTSESLLVDSKESDFLVKQKECLEKILGTHLFVILHLIRNATLDRLIKECVNYLSLYEFPVQEQIKKYTIEQHDGFINKLASHEGATLPSLS